jgi:RNA polymerase sigma-70 factor (ECF subfamily)
MAISAPSGWEVATFRVDSDRSCIVAGPATDLLLGAWPVSVAEREAIQQQLPELIAQARAAWPDVVLSETAYLDHLRTKLPTGEPVLMTLRKLYTADLYLACACSRGDAHALAAFEGHCLSTLDGALWKLGMSQDTTADVKQELRQLLLVCDGASPKIVTYAGRGNLRSWVRAIAIHNALSRCRKVSHEIPVEEDLLVQACISTGDPELESFKRFYRREFKAAFSDALRRLSDRQRTVLRQQLLDGLSIDELGVLYRVHRATAARWLEQARQQLLATTRELLLDRLHVRPPELDSIMRLIESQLEISLGHLVGRRKR